MRSSGNFHPEWGYLAPAPSFVRSLRTVLVAAAVGGIASAAVVLSLVERPTAAPDPNTPVVARTVVRQAGPPMKSAAIAPQPQIQIPPAALDVSPVPSEQPQAQAPVAATHNASIVPSPAPTRPLDTSKVDTSKVDTSKNEESARIAAAPAAVAIEEMQDSKLAAERVRLARKAKKHKRIEAWRRQAYSAPLSAPLGYASERPAFFGSW